MDASAALQALGEILRHLTELPEDRRALKLPGLVIGDDLDRRKAGIRVTRVRTSKA